MQNHPVPVEAAAHSERPGVPSPHLNRRLPPELALLEILVRMRLARPAQRRDWARLAMAQADPPLDEDRPVMRAWLGLSLDDPAIECDAVEDETATRLSRRDEERLEEADHLHRLVHRLEGQSRRQRRLLEQELLLRSSVPEDWHFHRAKWAYLVAQEEQAGGLLSPVEAARRAREGGVLFHPDQLHPGPLRQWHVLRRAVEMLEPALWLQLLRHAERGRPLDLVLPPGLWTHLRPWLAFLLGGKGLPFLEHYAGSLSELPPAATTLGGLLVLHSDGPLESKGERWARLACESGWRLCVVSQHGGPAPAFLNRLEAGSQSTDWVRRHLLARNPVERLMPLRDFVRQVERHYILDVLGLHHGVKSRACERLQISRQTLYTKLSQEADVAREGA